MNERNEEVLLRVDNLCQFFKTRGFVNKAVNNVNFDIKKGEVFGLVGESGCGKTTTGRTIIKIYNATSGSVYFKGQRICAGTDSYKEAIKEAKKRIGKEIADLKNSGEADAADKIAAKKVELDEIITRNREEIARANHDAKNCDKDYAASLMAKLKEYYEEKLRNASPDEIKQIKKEYKREMHIAKNTKLTTKIQMIFQDPAASLNPRMTVKEIISEGLVINGIKDKKYIEEKVYEILELVGLVREHAGRYPHEFSGGQQQRIGIARAVIMQPDMIIADEPISALDVSIQAQVINLLNELRDTLGLTIMFIAHDLSVVKYFSDRIGVMYFGNMVELATSEELFAHPLHPYTRSLLSAIPQPDPKTERERKRITYNAAAEHDYTVDKPTMREILPGHFVLCNDAEEKRYKEELGI